MNILGISAYYHDSAATLIQNGNIISAAQEERFTRIKHDKTFPQHAVSYCLKEANINLDDIDYVVFYDKPLLTFERLLETYLAFAPKGFSSFSKAISIWLKEKLFLKKEIKSQLIRLNNQKKWTKPVLFTQHHQAHAASAFFPSPFQKAVVMCLDGVGEWATTSLWLGEHNKLTPQWEICFPHSLGLLYSAFAYFTGFKVNSGEYKLMGLAPYGEPKYVNTILQNLIDIKDDGTFRLNMYYFDFATGFKMTNHHFSALFGRPPRHADHSITQHDMDLAASIQTITEMIMLKLAKTARREYDVENLCLAGGVALNCVANGKILKEKIFENIWIQPAAGDDGAALGAALTVWYEYLNNPRQSKLTDSMNGAYLGPQFSNAEIQQYLESIDAKFSVMPDELLFEHIADFLQQQKVIGWFQGRMEFGPRALGNRSIIGDARNKKMQSIVNLKIKFRESFRPFAPAVLEEYSDMWFDLGHAVSPYMLLVGRIKQNHLLEYEDKNIIGIDKLKIQRSDIPAVTHVDCSARIQTVHAETNPRFYHLMKKFHALTECPVIINTSFNVRGEPIVCSPQDAFRCFMSTHIDCLVMENTILMKSDQPSSLQNAYQTGSTVGVD